MNSCCCQTWRGPSFFPWLLLQHSQHRSPAVQGLGQHPAISVHGYVLQRSTLRRPQSSNGCKGQIRRKATDAPSDKTNVCETKLRAPAASCFHHLAMSPVSALSHIVAKEVKGDFMSNCLNGTSRTGFTVPTNYC